MNNVFWQKDTLSTFSPKHNNQCKHSIIATKWFVTLQFHMTSETILQAPKILQSVNSSFLLLGGGQPGVQKTDMTISFNCSMYFSVKDN